MEYKHRVQLHFLALIGFIGILQLANSSFFYCQLRGGSSCGIIIGSIRNTRTKVCAFLYKRHATKYATIPFAQGVSYLWSMENMTQIKNGLSLPSLAIFLPKKIERMWDTFYGHSAYIQITFVTYQG